MVMVFQLTRGHRTLGLTPSVRCALKEECLIISHTREPRKHDVQKVKKRSL